MTDTLRSITDEMPCNCRMTVTGEHSHMDICTKHRLLAVIAEYEKVDLVKRLRTFAAASENADWSDGINRSADELETWLAVNRPHRDRPHREDIEFVVRWLVARIYEQFESKAFQPDGQQDGFMWFKKIEENFPHLLNSVNLERIKAEARQDGEASAYKSAVALLHSFSSHADRGEVLGILRGLQDMSEGKTRTLEEVRAALEAQAKEKP